MDLQSSIEQGLVLIRCIVYKLSNFLSMLDGGVITVLFYFLYCFILFCFNFLKWICRRNLTSFYLVKDVEYKLDFDARPQNSQNFKLMTGTPGDLGHKTPPNIMH